MTQKYYLQHRDKILKRMKQYQKDFPEVQILQHIKQRCNNKSDKRYRWYGAKGIKCEITREEIRELMIRDNFWNFIRPTIDRVNKNKNYNKDNCQFIEHKENSVKDKRKIIIQYDLDENLIKEWISQAEAGRSLNIPQANICNCAKGIRNTAGGFKWKYKE